MFTILMPVHDGTIAKNLLRTDFLKYLVAQEQVRVVLVLQKADADAYEKEFGINGKVIIERAQIYNEQDKIEFVFATLFKNSIPTNFIRLRQADRYWNKGKYVTYYGTSLLRVLGQFSWWRTCLRWISELEPIDPKVKALYLKWQPDMVFAPTMLSRVEVALMRLARRDNKIVVGMAKSFDNLTSKAFLRVHPDRLIVPNETGIEEAVELYDFPRERVVATGICQYDVYTKKDFLEDRNSFFKNLALDREKKTILYAPAGDWMTESDYEVLAEILKWTDDGTFPATQVLLRLHPTYESQTEKLAGHPNLIVERPGKHYGDLKWYEFEEDDVRHLASSLAYSDVVISTGSSLMVEATIFNTPTLSIGFDGYTKKDYWHSVIRYYNREHLVPIVKSKGSPVVRSFGELKTAICSYFANPALDREERAEVVKRICYKMDGNSCKRTADVLLKSFDIVV